MRLPLAPRLRIRKRRWRYGATWRASGRPPSEISPAPAPSNLTSNHHFPRRLSLAIHSLSPGTIPTFKWATRFTREGVGGSGGYGGVHEDVRAQSSIIRGCR